MTMKVVYIDNDLIEYSHEYSLEYLHLTESQIFNNENKYISRALQQRVPTSS